MSAFDLLTNPTDSVFLNVMSHAYLMEQQFGSLLMPSPLGVYKIGEVDPVVLPGVSLFTEYMNRSTGLMAREEIMDFDKCMTVVVNEHGAVIIPSHMMANKASYISPQPTVPARGIKLIEMLVNHHLQRISPVTGHNRFTEKIAQQILPAHQEDEELVALMNKLCGSLLQQLDAFIGADIWHLYFIKRNNIDIIVEKTIDYRIFDWHRKNDKQDDSGGDH